MNHESREISVLGTVRKGRLEALLARHLEKQLLIIEAPPGYGKSEITEYYLRGQQKPYAWFFLRSLDNWKFFFWQHFCEELCYLYPSLTEHIDVSEFPSNQEQLADFLSAVYLEVTEHRESYFVFDGFQHLENEEIKNFIKHFIECEIPALHFVIINDQTAQLDIVFEQSSVSQAYMGEAEFSMRADELNDLLSYTGVRFDGGQIERLLDSCDAWPLALWLCIQDTSNEIDSNTDLFGYVRRYFEINYFEQFDLCDKKLLVKLALLDCFTLEMAKEIGSALSSHEVVLKKNPFVSYKTEDDIFCFKRVYRRYLTTQIKYLLTKDEIKETYSIAANLYIHKGRAFDALALLLFCERYDDFVGLVKNLFPSCTKRSQIDYLLHCFDQLPLSYLSNHPLAQYDGIVFRIFADKFEKIESDLNHLLEKNNENTELCGEIYFLLAYCCQIRGRAEFVDYYKKASECLPKGSRFAKEQIPFVPGSSFVMLPDTKPGALGRARQIYKNAEPFAEILIKEKAFCVPLVHLTEQYFYTHDLDAAQRYASEVIYNAKLTHQHEFVLVAHYYLARISLLRNSLDEAFEEIKYIEHYIQQHGLYRLQALQECISAVYGIYAAKNEYIPSWLCNEIDEESHGEFSHKGLIKAYYFLENNKPQNALSLLHQIPVQEKRGGSWIHRVYRNIFFAIAQKRLGEDEKALKALRVSYDTTYANGIITPFIEGGKGTRALLEFVLNKEDPHFDKKWLIEIHAKASSYAKNMSVIKRSSDHNQSIPDISGRKLEVLQALASGFTRNEIAQQLGLAPSTIKTHITSIYEILGAQNKADAIRIALHLGILN